MDLAFEAGSDHSDEEFDVHTGSATATGTLSSRGTETNTPGYSASGPSTSAMSSPSVTTNSSIVTVVDARRSHVEQRSSSSCGTNSGLGGRGQLPEIPYLGDGNQAKAVFWNLNGIWTSGQVQKSNKQPLLISLLNEEFENSCNPFSLALYLISRSPGFIVKRKVPTSNFCAYFVLEEFHKWISQHSKAEAIKQDCLVRALRRTCFEILISAHQSIAKKGFEAFYLKEYKFEFVYLIAELVRSQDYLKSCLAADYLNLHESFDVQDFLVPLLFINYGNAGMDYLQSCSKKKQLETIEFLDGFVGEYKHQKLQSYLLSCSGGPLGSPVLTNQKSVKSLIKKLAEKLDIPLTAASNCQNVNNTGTLYYLLRRKYVERLDFDDNNFDELIDQVVNDDDQMKREVVYHISLYDPEDAAKFAVRHHMPAEYVSQDVQTIMIALGYEFSQPEHAKDTATEENWDNYDTEVVSQQTHNAVRSTSGFVDSFHVPGYRTRTNVDVPEINRNQFYMMPIDRSQIYIVSTASQLNGFVEKLQADLYNADEDFIFVGVDSEWKPILPKFGGVALMQIAFLDAVYLIDVVGLKSDPLMDHSHWELFYETFFTNQYIFKVLFGGDSDFAMLARTVGQWKNIRSEHRSVLDLPKLHTAIVERDQQFFPFQSNNDEDTGLSHFIRLLFNVPVYKGQQLSDWERRPLSEDQIIYGATDAYCVLDAVVKIRALCREKDLDFEQIMKSLNCFTPQPKQRQSNIRIIHKIISDSKNCDSATQRPLRTPAPRFLCDSSALGLGKLLRACGWDTKLISDTDYSLSKCPWIMRYINGRVVVTGSKSVISSGVLPSEQIISVTAGSTYDFQLLEVANRLGIKVDPRQIYTRCPECNGNEFIIVSNECIKRMIPGNYSRLPVYDVRYPPSAMILQSPSDKDWVLLGECHIKFEDVPKTNKGVPIKLNHSTAMNAVDKRYVCNDCGGMFWESRVLEEYFFPTTAE